MGRIKSLKAILFLFGFVPFLVTGQNYPRFELYQLKQGTDSGQFIVTGLDSNLAFNNILRFRSADSTFLIGTDTVAVKSDIASSLLLYVDRVELGDSLLLYVDRTELGDSLALYPNRIELGDTALAIRTDIPLIINDSLTTRNFLTEEVDGSITNELQTLSKLGLDITLSDGGSTVRDSILTETQVDAFVANNGYLTTEVDGSITNELQTVSTSGAAGNITLSDGGGTLNLNVNDADASTTNEIQNISTSGAAGNISISSGSTLTLNVNDADASATNEGSLTVGAGTASTSVISSNTSGSTDVTLTAGSNITLSETGNNITIAASGGSSLWSEGATTGEIYYNSGNVGIGLTDPNFPLHVSGDIYSSDDIFVDDELVFGNVADGSVPYIDNLANYMYLSVNASSGTLFNFRDKYASTNPFTINANNATTILDFNGTSDFAGAMNIEGNLTQSGTIVQDGGSVTFNNTQSGSYDFGVGSLNHLPFMWVDASADKMAVGGGTPQYTLDVTGDINFTNKLYQNGVEVTFGTGDITGVTAGNGLTGGGLSGDVTLNVGAGTGIDVTADAISVDVSDFMSNGADNRIVTATGTDAMTAETNLTYDGVELNVGGDIDFSGDLYNNGVLVNFTGTTINNNGANRIISGSNTANTLEAYSNININNFPEMSFFNSTTGSTATDGTRLYLGNSSNNFLINNVESTGNISLLINNSTKLQVKSDGKIEISDLAGVSVVGADANGVLQAAASDTTLKTNIVPNKYGLKKVMDLETIKFNWKDKVSKGSQNEVGFNAQNLQKVIPEATYTIPSNGKLGIKDDAIIATLTKAIQEQQEMIEELQKKIKRIKRKIK